MSIRPYGHGKFSTILDSYAYGLTLDGGADEEESIPDGGGWYGLVLIDDEARNAVHQNAASDGDELTEEEEQKLDESVAVILFERSDGIVETTWFEDEGEAEDAWEEIQEDLDPDPEGDEDEGD